MVGEDLYFVVKEREANQRLWDGQNVVVADVDSVEGVYMASEDLPPREPGQKVYLLDLKKLFLFLQDNNLVDEIG